MWTWIFSAMTDIYSSLGTQCLHSIYWILTLLKLLFLQSSDTYIYMTIYFLASTAPLWFLGQITQNVKHVGSPKSDAQQCYIKFCVCKMLNHKKTTPF